MLGHALSEVARSLTFVRTDRGYGSESFGTAYAVSEDGHLITCHHVVEGAREIRAYFVADVPDCHADILDWDADSDLALLKARGVSGVDAAPVHEGKSVPLGREVAFMGFPYSDLFQPPLIMTVRGIIGNRYRIGEVDYYVVDAMCSEGFSGGPLFLSDGGGIVGTMSARFDPLLTKLRQEGADSTAIQGVSAQRTNLSFAIRSKYVIQLLERNQIAFQRRRTP